MAQAQANAPEAGDNVLPEFSQQLPSSDELGGEIKPSDLYEGEVPVKTEVYDDIRESERNAAKDETLDIADEIELTPDVEVEIDEFVEESLRVIACDINDACTAGNIENSTLNCIYIHDNDPGHRSYPEYDNGLNAQGRTTSEMYLWSLNGPTDKFSYKETTAARSNEIKKRLLTEDTMGQYVASLSTPMSEILRRSIPPTDVGGVEHGDMPKRKKLVSRFKSWLRRRVSPRPQKEE